MQLLTWLITMLVKKTLKFKLEETKYGKFECLDKLYIQANNLMQKIWYIIKYSKVFSKTKIQNWFYNYWKNIYDLPSQVIINCIDKVIEMFKASYEQRHLPSKPENIPIRLIRKRSYNIHEDGTVTIYGCGTYKLIGNPEHIKLAYLHGRGAELIKRDKGYYLHVTIEKNVNLNYIPRYKIGLDFGKYEIMLSILNERNELVWWRSIDFSKWIKIRKHHREVRRHKQRKCKRFRKESQEVRRFIEEVTKVIVDIAKDYQQFGVIVRVEDLKKLRKRMLKLFKKDPELRYLVSTMPYRLFYKRLEEKLTWEGIKFEQVNPKYTSKVCHRCGNFGIRNGKVFKCPYCGLEIDADLNAAINIAKGGYDYLKQLPALKDEASPKI